MHGTRPALAPLCLSLTRSLYFCVLYPPRLAVAIHGFLPTFSLPAFPLSPSVSSYCLLLVYLSSPPHSLSCRPHSVLVFFSSAVPLTCLPPPPPSSYAAPNRRRVSLLLPSPASQLDSFTASSLSVVRQQLSCLFRVLTFYRFFSSPLCQAAFIHPGLRASQPLPVSSVIYIYISREACLVNLKLIYTDFNISSFFDERSIN